VKSDEQQDTAPNLDWPRWLEEHTPQLLLFARQHARSEADAQDLLQEAVVECWCRAGAAHPPPLPLVFATLRRRAIDWARREDRRNSREQSAAEPQPECWFDTSLEKRERGHLIQTAMCQLPEIYRDVVTLKVWGNLTFAEIAQALEIPPNTAASRYRYGLAELRKLLREVPV
jgi:RNA polymerase sigma-70 factor, ECF subfamily